MCFHGSFSLLRYLTGNIRSQPPHVSTEEYRVTHHVMETMKQEMPTIVRSMVNINISIIFEYRYT